MEKTAFFEITAAVNQARAYSNGYAVRQPDPQDGRQWDSIVRFLCAGCRKGLHMYERLYGHAYCRECRMVLFPESIIEEYRSGYRPRPGK